MYAATQQYLVFTPSLRCSRGTLLEVGFLTCAGTSTITRPCFQVCRPQRANKKIMEPEPLRLRSTIRSLTRSLHTLSSGGRPFQQFGQEMLHPGDRRTLHYEVALAFQSFHGVAMPLTGSEARSMLEGRRQFTDQSASMPGPLPQVNELSDLGVLCLLQRRILCSLDPTSDT